ncbi:MAG: hypothetical protein JXQ96_07170 [Cyclobacteriaceae bacterium]
MKTQSKVIAIVLISLIFSRCETKKESQWSEDFKYQPVSLRPKLEVNYTDSSRTAFNILAQEYQVVGQLRKPHLLLDDKGSEWLSMEMYNKNGNVFSTQLSNEKSRINLYRRGPYFCEIHWFDLQLADEEGESLPLKGDLALYSYAEKLLAEITWHALEDFEGGELNVLGISPTKFDCPKIKSGDKKSFTFPLFGEQEPLSDNAFTLLEGKVPMRYYPRKGYYVIGTETSSSFQKQFYEFPNKYETASFTLKNNAQPRKIYVCHESVVGGAIVEGGAVLDKDGYNMPLLVQVSKNFGGEKEEKFYNPLDTAFSETFFPLYLEPDEEMTLTSLHLYQNWGSHMTKHWSSLGAWMDYFHSSTGVTETTCYVPFKFAGIGGVSIADFRAMSQEAFWSGQPQHDNLAGHSFLSFYDGNAWQHSKYESTIYRSTGPNWYDIQLNYISADGSIKITADIWETPQVDELRSFFNVKYEVLKPLTIEDAQANFRFLSVTSAIQRLRFNKFAASGIDEMGIDFSNSPFPIKGLKLPKKNAFVAEYGDSTRNRGSNAIIIREFTGPRGIGPAATLQTGSYQNRFKWDQDLDTRMLIVPDVEKLELQPGDVFEIDGYWLPYGPRDNADSPRRETTTYAADSPKVIECSRGEIVSDLPVKIKAVNNEAQFVLQGGKDLLPVVITGLTDWKHSRIWKKEGNDWRLLSHARNTVNDGYQVFSEEGGTYGAVFLVPSNSEKQTLKVSSESNVGEREKIHIDVTSQQIDGRSTQSLVIGATNGGNFPCLQFPTVASGSLLDWKFSEGNSLWFESDEGSWKRGGRVNPNQTDIDLEYWWQILIDANKMEEIKASLESSTGNKKDLLKRMLDGIESRVDIEEPFFELDLAGTQFEDTNKERTWRLTSTGWEKVENGKAQGLGIIAVQSSVDDKILCLAWTNASGITSSNSKVGVSLKAAEFGLDKRYHVRGKIYLIDNSLEVLKDRVLKELNI